jgi:hypothetical protein
MRDTSGMKAEAEASIGVINAGSASLEQPRSPAL